MAREKYPEKCPWDFGPDQNQADQANWKMNNGEDVVIFSRKNSIFEIFTGKNFFNKNVSLKYRVKNEI